MPTFLIHVISHPHEHTSNYTTNTVIHLSSVQHNLSSLQSIPKLSTLFSHTHTHTHTHMNCHPVLIWHLLRGK